MGNFQNMLIKWWHGNEADIEFFYRLDVEDIAKENHEVSSQVFERIESENDIDNMMAHLKGEYEKS